jgi:hypothetical protein
MECNFVIGQDVVCIKKGQWQSVNTPATGPAYNEIVTIEAITLDIDDDPCLELKGYSGLFIHWRFRPVRKNKAGMEMLRELQNPLNHKILEDVT